MTTQAWQFDGVVRFTRVGTSFLVFTFVIGFAALNTGNNPLYIALTFMLGCLLLSGIASKGGLKHLAIELRGAEEAWAGRPVSLVLRITNRSAIWNVRDVAIVSDDLAQPVLVPIIGKRETIDVEASFLFQRRGIAHVKRIDLYTRYPFGFFLKKRRVRLEGDVVVFPRLLDEEAARERFRPIAGEQENANRPGVGTEIHSFREYVRGDSLRQIYWKKSASLGRWIMKQTELDSARAVHVVFDPYKPREASDEAFEELVSETATYLFHAARRGLTILFTMPRVTIVTSESESASAAFHALALVEPLHEPVAQGADENSVVFALQRETGRGDERARA
ncbi:MAG TPA: DUF58 domain-containing protein [Thermoanaerobaculia bacterium]|jgi:uncharacterized protein (DUF58 family)